MKLWLSAVLAVVLCPGLTLGQSFIESFETGLPTGSLPNHAAPGASLVLSSGTWHAFNNSSPVGITGVFQQNLAGGVFGPDPSAGTNYAAMNFNSTSGVGTIDTYLMSPTLTFTNGDVISFFTRTVNTPSFPDRLRLVLSTNGTSTSPADFTTVLLTINPGLTTTGYPAAWTNFSATITGLAGPTSGRFAFNYNVTNGGPSGANSDFIGIDLASYSAAVPEPTTWALMGLSLTGAAGYLYRLRSKKKHLNNLALSAAR